LYPRGFDVGFSVARWLELCQRIDARDDDPPDRDERRAWYDTLRDLLPPVHGLRMTVRIYAAFYPWCSLSTDAAKDQETFCSLLKLP